MIKVGKILSYLTTIIKHGVLEEWDRSGLQVGTENIVTENVLVSLDLTTEALEKAVRNKCKLIVIHHPFIFEESLAMEFKINPYKKNIYERLLSLDISVYAMHTNYDSSRINSAIELIGQLKLPKTEKLPESPYGQIITTNLNSAEFCNLIKKKMDIKQFKINEIRHKVNSEKRIAFLPGSGSMEDMNLCLQNNVDTIITSDVKWNKWIWARESNIQLIEISHEIENLFVDSITNNLLHKFGKLNVIKHITREGTGLLDCD